MNALVANAKTASGLAVIRSLGKKGIEVTAVSDKASDFPMFSKYCTKTILLKTQSDDYKGRIDELLDIVKNDHYDVFLPVMTERSLLAFSKRRDEFEQYTRFALPSFDQLSVLNNKATVSRLLTELGINGPKTYFIDSGQDLESVQKNAIFPVVIKAFIGEGSEGVKVITDPAGLIQAYHDITRTYGPAMIQEFVHGVKHTAVFLLNKNSEVRRFFVHRALREYPVTGGPTCFLKSVKYDLIYDYGFKLLKRAAFTGLAAMEFIIDEADGKPRIIDVNPRFYGPLQCAVSAGADFPFAVYNMALKGDIETDLSYKEGVRCRHLLFEDTKHMISIMKGAKSPKYKVSKVGTLLRYLNFFQDDSYFVLSVSDPRPALKKIFSHL